MTAVQFEPGEDDAAMYAEERIMVACERLLRRTGIRANRANVNLAEYGGIIRRLHAKIEDAGETPYFTLHTPTGTLRVTYDLSLEGTALIVFHDDSDPVPAATSHEVKLMRTALPALTVEQLQERYESEEDAAMIAMKRAQRTLAEIARRRDGGT